MRERPAHEALALFIVVELYSSILSVGLHRSRFLNPSALCRKYTFGTPPTKPTFSLGGSLGFWCNISGQRIPFWPGGS